MVRIIYVPESDTVEVRHLGRQAEYAASWFDPVTGARRGLPPAKADDDGSWKCAPPADVGHDWVLILESRRDKDASKKNSRADENSRHGLTLADKELAWHLDWSDGRLHNTYFDNKLSGHRFGVSADRELALNFSAAIDRVAQPYNRVSDFEVRGMRMMGAAACRF